MCSTFRSSFKPPSKLSILQVMHGHYNVLALYFIPAAKNTALLLVIVIDS